MRCRTVSREDAENSTRDASAPPNPLLRHRHVRAFFLEGWSTRVPRVGGGVPPQPIPEARVGSAMIQGMA